MKAFIKFLFILIPSISEADMIIGGEIIYQVVKGDTIELISARLGGDKERIIRDNNIDIKKYLKIGQEIRVNTKKIVPKNIDDGIIINIPERMLYFFKNSRLELAFPVGLGMLSPKWRTPLGNFTVLRKEKNPTWYVPKSIQKEMEMKNQPVKMIVPPGPDNPLGRYAIKISIPGILIHETIWPTTVYQFRSHGCIRVLPEVMEKFFNLVEINTRGELIYNPIKVAVSEGRVYLEVHKDIYGRFKEPMAEARRLIEEHGVMDKVDWDKVDLIIKENSGIAEDVTLR